MTTTSTSPTATSSDTVRRCFLAGAMALTPLLLIASVLLSTQDPDDDGVVHLNAIAPDRDQFYASLLLGALGFAMLGVAAHGLVLLARRRGGALATIGWILLLIGGTSAAAALFLYGTVIHLATDPSLDREAMGALDTLGSDSWTTGLAFVLGFIPLTVGLLVMAAGLYRARTVPVWMSALLGLSPLLIFFVQSDNNFWMAVAYSPLLVLIALAYELLRPERTIVMPSVPDNASSLAQDPGSHTEDRRHRLADRRHQPQ